MLTPGWARRSSTSRAQIWPPPMPARPQTSAAVHGAAIDGLERLGARAPGPSVPRIAVRTARKITAAGRDDREQQGQPEGEVGEVEREGALERDLAQRALRSHRPRC